MSSNIYIQRICQECNQEFTARTTVTKFCSPPCAKNNYKKRKIQKQVREVEKEVYESRLKVIKTIQEKEFLSLKETSLLLGISRTTLYRMRKKGMINFTQIGNKKVIRRKDIDMMFNASKSVFLMNSKYVNS